MTLKTQLSKFENLKSTGNSNCAKRLPRLLTTYCLAGSCPLHDDHDATHAAVVCCLQPSQLSASVAYVLVFELLFGQVSCSCHSCQWPWKCLSAAAVAGTVRSTRCLKDGTCSTLKSRLQHELWHGLHLQVAIQYMDLQGSNWSSRLIVHG
jgi:hypothetical protein